jgi:hypothetical protein
MHLLLYRRHWHEDTAAIGDFVANTTRVVRLLAAKE